MNGSGHIGAGGAGVLPGVESRRAQKCIRRAARKHLMRNLAGRDAAILVAALGIYVVAGTVAQVTGWDVSAWLTGIVGGFLSVLMLQRHFRRRVVDCLPVVLEEMGRCTHCGYKLEGETSACPECGHMIEDSVDRGRAG